MGFLQQTLRMKGFSQTWCSWIQTFVQGGNVGIKVNDQVGSYLQTKKRPKTKCSSILVNIVVGMLVGVSQYFGHTSQNKMGKLKGLFHI